MEERQLEEEFQEEGVVQYQTQEQIQEKKDRIKIWMAACLILVALLIDVLEFILAGVAVGAVLNPIISLGTDFLFWLWFNLLGVPMLQSPKRFFTMLLQGIGEFAPEIDGLPFLTIGVILIILFTWAEDKGGIMGKVAGIAESFIGRNPNKAIQNVA